MMGDGSNGRKLDGAGVVYWVAMVGAETHGEPPNLKEKEERRCGSSP